MMPPLPPPSMLSSVHLKKAPVSFFLPGTSWMGTGPGACQTSLWSEAPRRAKGPSNTAHRSSSDSTVSLNTEAVGNMRGRSHELTEVRAVK